MGGALDWNGDKVKWSKARPMDVEEDMYSNMRDVKAASCPPAGGRCSITWVYRNGIKVRGRGVGGVGGWGWVVCVCMEVCVRERNCVGVVGGRLAVVA